MTVVTIEIEHVGNLDEARRRLGDTGHIHRAMGDLLDESARLGEQSAEMYAPERSRRLRRHISSRPAHRTPRGLEAAVGVGAVNELPGGGAGPLVENESEYPYFVHEGTGIYGRLHTLIRPRRARAMRFIGRTGLVFAKTTKGQRPQPFIREALDDVEAYLPQRIDEMVTRILER